MNRIDRLDAEIIELEATYRRTAAEIAMTVMAPLCVRLVEDRPEPTLVNVDHARARMGEIKLEIRTKQEKIEQLEAQAERKKQSFREHGKYFENNR